MKRSTFGVRDLGLVALIVLLGVAMFVLSGCSTPRDYKQVTFQIAEYGVSTVEVKKYNKVCVLYRDGDDNFAMQCFDLKKED